MCLAANYRRSSGLKLSLALGPMLKKTKTRGPWTLEFCLTTPVGMKNGNFLQTCTCVKTYCCRLKNRNAGLSLTVPRHPCINIRSVSLLSKPRKGKCGSVIGLPMYGSLVVSNSNIWPNSAPL